MKRHCVLTVLFATSLACQLEDDGAGDGYQFGPESGTPNTGIPTNDSSDQSDESTSGDTGSDESSSSGGDEPSAEDSTTTGNLPPTSAGEESTGDPVDPTGDNPGGNQPATGVYSHCLDANACDTGVCLQIQDGNMNVTDGFCTALGCQNPASCPASPGGTATPTCYAVMAQDGPDAVCALDCSGGKTCPLGMTCQSLTGGQVCA